MIYMDVDGALLHDVADVDMDSLDVSVARREARKSVRTPNQVVDHLLVQSILSKLATNTRLLETTERNVGVQLVGTVNPDRSCLHPVSRGDGAVDVFAEDSGGKAVH